MTSPLPELTHITLESLAYRVKKMNQNAVLKEELWTRTQEQQRRELVILERLKACKKRHWEDEDGSQKYFDMYDEEELEKLIAELERTK
jgi:hypothetical protein